MRTFAIGVFLSVGILVCVVEWREHRNASALARLESEDEDDDEQASAPPPAPRGGTVDAAGAGVEQTSQGTRDPLPALESFDGLGSGFTGPQGTANLRNPSDNSLAVGPDHVVQIVNSRICAAPRVRARSRF